MLTMKTAGYDISGPEVVRVFSWNMGFLVHKVNIKLFSESNIRC